MSHWPVNLELMSDISRVATVPFAWTVYPNCPRLILNNVYPRSLNAQMLTIVIQVLAKLMSDKREEILRRKGWYPSLHLLLPWKYTLRQAKSIRSSRLFQSKFCECNKVRICYRQWTGLNGVHLPRAPRAEANNLVFVYRSRSAADHCLIR